MSQEAYPAELKAAQYWAKLTDSRFSIFGVGFGLDSLVGLIPVLGDVIMLLPALRIFWLGRALGTPFSIQVRMLFNILLDLFIGSVPVLGDLFDLLFKANQANFRLLENWWHRQQAA